MSPSRPPWRDAAPSTCWAPSRPPAAAPHRRVTPTMPAPRPWRPGVARLCRGSNSPCRCATPPERPLPRSHPWRAEGLGAPAPGALAARIAGDPAEQTARHGNRSPVAHLLGARSGRTTDAGGPALNRPVPAVGAEAVRRPPESETRPVTLRRAHRHHPRPMLGPHTPWC